MSIQLPSLPGLGEAAQSAFATPSSYASPEAIKAQRDYANALLYHHVGDRAGGAQFPVVQSWTQGVSNMVNALMGGRELYDANQREQKTIADANTNAIPNAAPAVKTSFNEGPSSEGQTNLSDDSDIARKAKAIASIESAGSGGYNAIGPTVLHGSYAGDKAYGKYQVMGKNVPVWTKEVFGQAMTPDEFLHNPQAQDAIFKAKFTTPRDWFGHGYSDGYMTGKEYENRYAKALGAPAASTQAAAFAGSDAGASGNPAVKAMSSALKGDNGTQVAENTQVAAGRPAIPGVPLTKGVPQPDGSGIYYDPDLVRAIRPQYTPQQMQAIMNHPTLTPEAKAQAFQAYQQRNQAIELPWAGGKVLIDPNNPLKQQFISEGHWGETDIGGIKGPKLFVPGGHGTVTQSPIIQPPVPPAAAGPRSEAVPPAQPSAAPPGATTPAAGPVQATAQNAPAAPEMPSQAPTQVASLDPTAGVSPTAGNVPPTPTPVASEQPAPTTPLAKFAQSGPPPGVSAQDWNTYTQKQSHDNAVALKQKAGEAEIDIDKNARNKNNDLNAKRYQDMMVATQSAYHQLDNLRTANRQLHDPQFYSGLFANEVEGLKKLGALFGGDPNSSKPMEVFRKTMASQIADGLKAAYGGLGQIRNKEIELSEKSNGSLSNSLPANLALVEISRRSATRLANLGEMANDYRLGHEVLDPISKEVLVPANVDKGGNIIQRVGLDPGYDKAANTFVKSHPMFSEQEYKDFDKLFDEKKSNTTEKVETKPTGGFATPPAEAIQHLKDNPGTKGAFEKHFGPADQYLGK